VLITETAFLVAATVAIVGLAIIPWAFRQATWTRIGLGLIYLCLYAFVLGRAGIEPVHPAPAAFQAEARVFVQGLQLLWWFVFARCLIAIGRVFLLYRHKLHERKFATDLLAGLVYLAVAVSVTGLVLQVPVTGLLATSGVVAIVLGLALQSTVSDLFAGIALTLERPYRIGDLIGLEGDVQGTVIEITWRATHIMTSAQDDVVVPNSIISKSRIINYSYPVRVHGVSFEVALDDRTSPPRGIEILEHALLQCRSVRRTPRPQATTSHFGSGSIGYSVFFFVDSVEAAAQAKSEVLALIYRHVRWAGVSLGRWRRVRSGPHLDVPSHDRDGIVGILERTPFLAELSATEREALGAALIRRQIAEGEIVFEQGQPGDSVFVVEAGVVSARRANGAGIEEEIARLGPGDCFGSNAVVTGAPRNATIRALARSTLHEICQENIAPLLKEHEHLRNSLGSMLARYTSGNAMTSTELPPGNSEKPTLQLFKQLARLFSSDIDV
jgi:small-conductance mechanosensitive channel/CRP-like cAMP-binding protein